MTMKGQSEEKSGELVSSLTNPQSPCRQEVWVETKTLAQLRTGPLLLHHLSAKTVRVRVGRVRVCVRVLSLLGASSNIRAVKFFQ